MLSLDYSFMKLIKVCQSGSKLGWNDWSNYFKNKIGGAPKTSEITKIDVIC
jgi:hypothetical protein